ncbi:hypothetical protein Halru_0323 [Halovivax ruber XH-70]|uniref:Uncharacterized protein n=1 Tax=Halovivax ruber (strain DSM 18193 / JCM 13892 / XH-70) TaxID=797302 RepID=L0IAI9_HALRX|nr:hypothetical protein [Halovivax ruber]AGB14967.1 hypothetical protein Halru_0323 [Halovivax ruber XH-70]
MMGGSLTKLGAVLVVAGALLMAGPVFGFSTLAADRGTTVETAPTESALLGIQPTGETPDNQNDAPVLTVTNNANERFDTLDTQAEIVSDPNGALAISDGFGSSLDPDAQTDLSLTCASGGTGQATVEVTANAVGSTLAVEDITYTHTFSYSCTGNGGGGPPGFVSVSAGDVTGSNTQELTFALDGKLNNGETVTIDITSFLANYDGASIDSLTVGGSPARKHDRTFEPASGSATITVTAKGNIKAGKEVRIVLDGVSPEFDFFSWATFSTASSQASDTFAIDSGGGWMTTASTAGDTGSVDGTISREELESIPLAELERFDSYDDLERYIEAETDIEVVDSGG